MATNPSEHSDSSNPSKQLSSSSNNPHTDIQQRFWLDRIFKTPKASAFIRLARFDRPIGAWLLLIPALWSIWLSPGVQPVTWATLILMSVLFFVGALVMRAAGCVVNDLWDRDLDARVTRTAQRPLASGVLTVREALIFLGVLLAIGLVIVLNMPPITLALAVLSLVFVALYPLAKRFTHWPQAMLGLTFNFGALMGTSAVLGAVPGFALALYMGCVAWTIGYDTIYAHQDRDDDASVGIKSTALLFGKWTQPLVRLFFVIALLFWALAIVLANGGFWAWGGLLVAAATLGWQVRAIDINDPAKCLALFKFSAWTGWSWTLALVLERLL